MPPLCYAASRCLVAQLGGTRRSCPAQAATSSGDVAIGHAELSKLENNANPAKSSAARATMLGAVIASIAASACCVLPAILAVVGISGASLGTALVPYRPLLLGGTAVLLGLGFYLTYRKARGASEAGVGDGACGCPTPRTRSSGRTLLWLAALATLFFAAYPYIGARTQTESQGDAVLTAESQTAVLHIDGMNCESCVPAIVDALSTVPGVVEARVLFDDH